MIPDKGKKVKVLIKAVPHSDAGPMIVHEHTTISGYRVWYPPNPTVRVGKVIDKT